jgi:muramoyltetrapeptide carboxypeptidase LdcA involved in peptidoglycan recycling
LNKQILEPLLPHGSAIGIVSPSHFLEGERVEMVKGGMRKLNELGFQIKEGRHHWTKDAHGISAGSILERVKDIHYMLLDDSVSAIWFSQGGLIQQDLNGGCRDRSDHNISLRLRL